ncbi:MAG: hypothetical protein PHD51_00690 [Patescibacteria group bacterium]|nr:hypothetical protein [Patescibacteria group bacterium]MDD5490616.1 hypothetical protein [Patescibacteria group bacterium]
MKKLNVAFLYNVRHSYPDPQNPATQLEADFDDPETIKTMIVHLKKCGFKVLPIEADEYAYDELLKNRRKIDLVFNYSLGIYGRDRYAHLPAILEMLRLPYTGSGPLTQALILYKARFKQILLANKISTLPFQIFKNSRKDLREGLEFPLIVKPVAQGSSAGITNQSVVLNRRELKKQINFIISTFKEPALVEPFLTGREFSVALLGNPPRILPILESDHGSLPAGYQPLDSLEVKWVLEEDSSRANHLICPANIDKKLKDKIAEICLKAWEVLDILDWCRMDVRCDRAGNPYILDINSPAGLMPPKISATSYFPLIARTSGMSYEDVLKSIINAALERNKIKKI